MDRTAEYGAPDRRGEIAGHGVGDQVEFGHYPQDSDGEWSTIKWIVLAMESDRALLLSKWGLETSPFHSSGGRILWSKSELRRWLNGPFCQMAFEPQELKRLLYCELENGGSSLYDAPCDQPTQDRVFLLSPLEVEDYLPRRDWRLCVATPYAQRRGADMYESGDRRYEGFVAWWWLRWPGSYGNATYLYSSGDIFNDFGVECASGVVRPALWVAL